MSKAMKFKNFLESLNGGFHVVLRHGDQNKQKTEDNFTCSSPHEAAKKFLAKYFPKEDLYSVRVERTLEDGKQSWSAGTSASGQRIWIYEK